MAVRIVKGPGEILYSYPVVSNYGDGQPVRTMLLINKPGNPTQWQSEMSDMIYLNPGDEAEFRNQLEIRLAMEPGIYDVRFDAYNDSTGQRVASALFPGEVEILAPGA